MATIQQLLDRKKDVSSQASTQTRTLALGLLGISWALLTAHDEPLHTMALHVNHLLILGVIVCSVVVIVSDLFQYFAATAVAEEAVHRAEKATPKEALYDTSLPAYKIQAFLYHFKLWMLGVAALLIAVVFVSVFRAPLPPANQSPASQTGSSPPP